MRLNLLNISFEFFDIPTFDLVAGGPDVLTCFISVFPYLCTFSGFIATPFGDANNTLPSYIAAFLVNLVTGPAADCLGLGAVILDPFVYILICGLSLNFTEVAESLPAEDFLELL